MRTSVRRLTEHIDVLREAGYSIVGLTDALAATTPTVALTFDDAYADFLEAAPVLADRGVGATMYAPTGLIGGSADWMTASDDRVPLLTGRDLASLAMSGIEVGVHGRMHRALDVVDAATLRAEVVESKCELEHCTGTPVRSFAYPYGYANRRSRSAVVAAGYTNACVLGHALHRRAEDPFAVRRLLITSADDGVSVLRRVRTSVTSPRAVYTAALRVPWRLTRWAMDRTRRTVTTQPAQRSAAHHPAARTEVNE
jgi:peptidoglycan/xylan/chitin deacetylase (PgdA/CDA1 family)